MSIKFSISNDSFIDKELLGVICMNVLIFYVSIGNGHNQVAHTLKNSFITANSNNIVKVINILNLINPILDKFILDSYLKILRFYPKAWGKIYNKTNRLHPIVDINDITNKIISSKLKKFILDFHPDVIFCTHSFSSSIIAGLKEKKAVDSPLITLITDYNIHSSYINDYTDYYVIAHENLIPCIELHGVKSNQILPFGIPIKPDFSIKLNKKDILDKLSIKDKTTILVMGGGLGLGSIFRIVNELDNSYRNIQILVITGHNYALYKKLKSIKTVNELKIFGFIPNVHELMEICDCIITKPGGVTCAEIFSKSKPLIIYSPFPGQESDNTSYLLNYGVAVIAHDVKAISHLINMVLNAEMKKESIKKFSAYLYKPNAVADLVKFTTKKYSKTQS